VNATGAAHLSGNRLRVKAVSEKVVSLPASRAFVIQLQASSKKSSFAHRGRVEHLASGRATHFPDEYELWAFIDSVLEKERSEQSKAEG